MPLVIDTDIHRLENERDIVLRCDRGAAPQCGDDVLVHLLLRHAIDVIAGDDAHHPATKALGEFARFLELLDEAIMVFWIIQTGRESPGRELDDFDVQLLTKIGNGVDVFALVRPEFYAGVAEPSRLLDAAQERQTRPPHFEVGRELGVSGAAQTRNVVLLGGRGEAGACDRGGRGGQKIAALHARLLSKPTDRRPWAYMVIPSTSIWQSAWTACGRCRRRPRVQTARRNRAAPRSSSCPFPIPRHTQRCPGRPTTRPWALQRSRCAGRQVQDLSSDQQCANSARRQSRQIDWRRRPWTPRRWSGPEIVSARCRPWSRARCRLSTPWRRAADRRPPRRRLLPPRRG